MQDLLGGVNKFWCIDRLSTVYNVSSRDDNTEFATYTKHYGSR